MEEAAMTKRTSGRTDTAETKQSGSETSQRGDYQKAGQTSESETMHTSVSPIQVQYVPTRKVDSTITLEYAPRDVRRTVIQRSTL